MAALGTRAFLQDRYDYYLCPLVEKQMPEETLETYLKPVWSGCQASIPIYKENATGQVEKIAEGYER
jgi:hypothetical protein